ncbi:copper chaperone PCu(A)C [Streptomyces sp. NPDC059851]|uniref:copper chaperone PCu(A)C n=1 Tax=Streptomyces sp. NPDC059851 TaxID=3346971 RepID=UPI0036568346
MTGPFDPHRPTEPVGSWRPTGRRLLDGARAALAPAVACLAALVGLTAWTTAGAAGSPPRIEVGLGHVFLPPAEEERTAASFRVTNIGGADDQLVSVTSPAVEEAVLSRHERVGAGAGTLRVVDSVDIPAGGSVDMTPSTLDVTVKVRARWQGGEAIPFVLHFRRSGPVDVVAFVVRPDS